MSREDIKQIIAATIDNFPLFARLCLKIRDKDGELVPFVLNPVQQRVNAMLDKQLAETGRVRAIVLKGRRLGLSTLIAARFYWKATLQEGKNVFIIAHDQPATTNLFGFVARFQQHNPVAPPADTSNVKELRFGSLDSSYRVAPAGDRAGAGRSMNLHYVHQSEVAFWKSAKEHMTAINTAVPRRGGTEIIAESTACGPTGAFYQLWNDAMAGKSSYIPIFVPWFEDPVNRMPVPPDFELEPDEVEYQKLYRLDLEQMAWARDERLTVLGGDWSLFHQENPATPELAFSKMDGESFINLASVIVARQNHTDPPDAPVILGVDPASMGGDRFAIAARQGNKCLWVRTRNKVTQDEAVQWVRECWQETEATRINVDLGNIGTYLVASLISQEPELSRAVVGVNFGGTAQAKLADSTRPGPANRRAEMYERLRDWLEGPLDVDIPDDDALQSDLVAPKKLWRKNDFLLEAKTDMKKRGVRSPDKADALALTFASNEYLPAKKQNRDAAETDTRDRYRGASGAYSWMGH